MKKGKLKSILKFTGVILIPIVGIAFIFIFEFYLADVINKGYVVVAKENIDFKERITEDDLIIKGVSLDDIVDDSYTEEDLNKIIGGFASVDIKKGVQLYPELVDYYDIIPDETKGEFVAPLPNQWLFAVPGSIRRTYIADIYAVGTNDQRMLESLIKDSQVADGEGTPTTDSVVRSTLQPILKNVVVSSVKDSSNKEVAEDKGEGDTASLGAISSLEIIATEETLAKIQEKASLGYQLYIVYKFDKTDEKTDDSEQTKDK